jgi:hypothetical protein
MDRFVGTEITDDDFTVRSGIFEPRHTYQTKPSHGSRLSGSASAATGVRSMHGLGVALLVGPKDSLRRLSNTNAHCRVERTTHDTAHDRHDLGEIDDAPLTGLG